MPFMIGIAFLSLQIGAHDADEEHLHCDDEGVQCEEGEDIVYGSPENPPNSGPTPYTGGSSPTNSSSENCEGSGCIDYETSYNDFGFPICEEGYEPVATNLDIRNNPAGGLWVCQKIMTLEDLQEELNAMYDALCKEAEEGTLEKTSIAAVCGAGCFRIVQPKNTFTGGAYAACAAGCYDLVSDCL